MHRRSNEIFNDTSRLPSSYMTSFMILEFEQGARRLRTMQCESTFGSMFWDPDRRSCATSLQP
jgi:hypothetical protein